MADEVVLYKKENWTGLITINRPEVKNALNMAIFRSLDKVLDQIEADEEVRAVIVTGAGNSFVAGADINEFSTFDMIGGLAACRINQSVFTRLESLGKPSIAAINGVCFGGGLELALSCTLRMSSARAKLGFPEIGLGIIPAYGGTERLRRCVGYGVASDLLLSRTVLTGEEALRIGLVNRVVEEDQILIKAREWASDLASLSPVAVRAQIELLLNGEGQALQTCLSLESALCAMAAESKEAKSLLEAFKSKGKGKGVTS
jgi:enoyl-CoA hydratase